MVYDRRETVPADVITFHKTKWLLPAYCISADCHLRRRNPLGEQTISIVAEDAEGRKQDSLSQTKHEIAPKMPCSCFKQ